MVETSHLRLGVKPASCFGPTGRAETSREAASVSVKTSTTGQTGQTAIGRIEPENDRLRFDRLPRRREY
jgi:hypothetical protein